MGPKKTASSQASAAPWCDPSCSKSPAIEASDTAAAGSKRGTNWTNPENNIRIWAGLEASQEPVTGNEEHKITFWGAILILHDKHRDVDIPNLPQAGLTLS
ncbi:hypothetical protein BDK51DRAFT_27976 [Blyttiomyces helicus]|uniref:Uncharacterized protein n=1 Tax=Blyttiomyces helicus TaxID=388810 RepID=A0A4P9WEI3_9FUNG|nr:hypothetical protein BDK51DRAFT_27976 [Blyttiomyces helicus]|eukprot:RKO91004.1 hypothetical protein BDK51DRAFT_27976 [Blyttiomyces helicus]